MTVRSQATVDACVEEWQEQQRGRGEVTAHAVQHTAGHAVDAPQSLDDLDQALGHIVEWVTVQMRRGNGTLTAAASVAIAAVAHEGGGPPGRPGGALVPVAPSSVRQLKNTALRFAAASAMVCALCFLGTGIVLRHALALVAWLGTALWCALMPS